MIMKLFETSKVKKFFNILSRIDRYTSNIWVNPNARNVADENKICYYCAKEVFVNRTLKKWLKSKHLILFVESEQTELEYKQYIQILNISYILSYGDVLNVNYYDYSKPCDVWNSLKIDHNTALYLEGIWCEDNKIHNELLKFFVLDIPEREFIFEAVDWNKFPKTKKKGQTADDIYELLKEEISFKAKTEKEAYRKMRKFQKESKLLIQPDIKRIV